MHLSTKLVAAALLGSTALAAAAPAHAQYSSQRDDRYQDRDDRRWDDRDDRDDRRYDDRRYDSRGRAQALRAQIQQIEYRVQRTDWRDRISEREAYALRRSVSDLRRQYDSFARGGFDRREVQILESRIQQLRQRLNYERRDDGNRRW